MNTLKLRWTAKKVQDPVLSCFELAHISLKRSVEMLALQCAQRFPARPADPDSSVFAELFSAPHPEPSQSDVPTAKAK